FFAPPVLLVTFALSLVSIPLHATGVLSGWVGWLTGLVYLGPILYLALLLLAAIASTGSLADRGRFALVLATMHLSWGGGFLVGLLRGARDAVDTSRTES